MQQPHLPEVHGRTFTHASHFLSDITVCCCQGTLAPTSAQVISAQPFNSTTPVATGTIAVNSTYTDYAGTVTGVSKTTSYSVWLVGEDNNTSPNIMPQVWSIFCLRIHVSGNQQAQAADEFPLVWHLEDVMPVDCTLDSCPCTVVLYCTAWPAVWAP